MFSGKVPTTDKKMKFLIADSFTDSLARLTGDEQKQVKTTAFDLQLNPANPGHRFHKLDRTVHPACDHLAGAQHTRL